MINKELNNIQLEKISGGSLENAGEGKFRVFNAMTGEDFGIFDSYERACKEARAQKISAIGTWGDLTIGSAVRLKEDRTHRADRDRGSGSFDN